MIRVLAAVLLLAQGLEAQSLSPAHDPVRLELQGRLREAWTGYHELLLSRDFGADQSTSGRLRVFLLNKLAALSVSLGRTEEAYDLGRQLVALGAPEAIQAGETVRRRLAGNASPPWKVPNGAGVLADPSDVFSPVAGAYSRLQLGAFRDWIHTRTMLDMLAEKGWVAWVEDRWVKKERLQAVFVVSRNVAVDLRRLKEQGFDPVAVSIQP